MLFDSMYVITYNINSRLQVVSMKTVGHKIDFSGNCIGDTIAKFNIEIKFLECIKIFPKLFSETDFSDKLCQIKTKWSAQRPPASVAIFLTPPEWELKLIYLFSMKF